MQNKISRRQFLQVTGASAAALLLAGLPVEASAASGHLTVTPDTLVSDLRADPTFAASGVWTWQSAVDSPDHAVGLCGRQHGTGQRRRPELSGRYL